VEKVIQDLIPLASAIPNESWEPAEESSHPGTHLLDTKPLTVGLMYHYRRQPFEELEEAINVRRQEFFIDWPVPPTAKVSTEFERSVANGYRTIVQADRITNVTCNVVGRAATGEFSFQVPEIGKGTVQYSANHEAGNWQITEFRLPTHNWRFQLAESGKWKWFDHFGDTNDPERFQPLQHVTGHVKFKGEPLSNTRIHFVHLNAPEVRYFTLPLPKTDTVGKFATRLPVGTYAISVRNDAKPRDGSRMLVKVGEGENHFVFDLVETETRYKY
jgi:hypothetical protein